MPPTGMACPGGDTLVDPVAVDFTTAAVPLCAKEIQPCRYPYVLPSSL